MSSAPARTSIRGVGRLQMARVSATRSTTTTLAADAAPSVTVTPLTSTPSSASPARIVRPFASSPTVPTKAARIPSRAAATAAVAAGPPPAYTTSLATTRSSAPGKPSTRAIASSVATPTKTASTVSTRFGEVLNGVAIGSGTPSCKRG